ncbi:MAG: hypothetical protein ACMG5Z_01305 [Luteimonas sp.]
MPRSVDVGLTDRADPESIPKLHAHRLVAATFVTDAAHLLETVGSDHVRRSDQDDHRAPLLDHITLRRLLAARRLVAHSIHDSARPGGQRLYGAGSRPDAVPDRFVGRRSAENEVLTIVADYRTYPCAWFPTFMDDRRARSNAQARTHLKEGIALPEPAVLANVLDLHGAGVACAS